MAAIKKLNSPTMRRDATWIGTANENGKRLVNGIATRNTNIMHGPHVMLINSAAPSAARAGTPKNTIDRNGKMNALAEDQISQSRLEFFFRAIAL